jgi:hypothetical protein
MKTPNSTFVNLDLIGYVSAVAARLSTPPDCFISLQTSSVPGLPWEECLTLARCSASTTRLNLLEEHQALGLEATTAASARIRKHGRRDTS